MTLTPEQIVENFRSGTSGPLQGAADELQRMVAAYRELTERFDVLRSQASTAWTGDAAFASSDRANELCAAVSRSAELLDTCAQAHGAQTVAFETASANVVPIPPEPTKPTVLEMIEVAVNEGPGAPFERAADYREAMRAHHEAAEHNVAVYDEYYWSTTDNQDIPADYPNPVLFPRDGMTGVPTDSPGGYPPPEPPEVGGGGPEQGGGGSVPGGGIPVGAGLGGSGGGIGDPGPLDVSPLTDDSSSDLPPGPPGGHTTPNDAGPPVVHNPPPPLPDTDGPPPPRNPPPPVVPPVGGGVPGPGGRDGARDPRGGDQSTNAARAGTGSDLSSLGMPFGGVGDRTGGDVAGPGSQLGRGAGGPGGGPGSPGSLGGGRAGGAGGLGGFGGMPAGSAKREEDKEHTRPEYLIEPDPNEIFGSDQSVSSPVIGAAWKPERHRDGNE